MTILLFLLIFAIKSLWDFREPSPPKIHWNAPTQRTLTPSFWVPPVWRSFIPKMGSFFLDFDVWWLCCSPRSKSITDFQHLDLDIWWLCFSPWSKFVMGFLHLYSVLWWLWLCLLLFLSLFVMMCFSSRPEQIWRTPSCRLISVDDPYISLSIGKSHYDGGEWDERAKRISQGDL